MFSATGFQPEELLDFSVAISDDNGLWLPDIAWTDVPADASGGAEVDYIVPQTWANKTLQLTVMGLTSGLMATTTFTDAATANVNFAASGLPSGTIVTVNVDYTNNGGNHIMGTYNFSSPGPGANIGTLAHSSLSYTFPATIVVGTNTYDLISSSPTSPFTTGDGAPAPATTVTGTYQLHVVTPTNQPPVITCLNPTPDLGQAVGCLGTGTGFGHDFPVTYDDDGPGTIVTVTAHFTTPNGIVETWPSRQ